MGRSLLVPGGLEMAQAVMGVCPQFDVLWDELSGREHMFIYGCIKGMPISEVCQQLLLMLWTVFAMFCEDVLNLDAPLHAT